MGKFIDPRADWAFKRIFGSDDTKESLITFLNGMFKGEFIIKDVKFIKNEQVKRREEERGVIFDVECKTTDGKYIIVEMQKKEQEFFVDRAIYYTAKAITAQGIKGRWNFHLTPVYTICLMDFIVEEGIEPRFRTDFALCNLNTGKQETEKIRIVYLQLPLFDGKTEEDCKDDIFKCWIYILRNMSEFEQMPFIDKNPVFRKLAAISDLRKLTPEEHEMYDEDIKVMRDLYATRLFELKMRKKGREKAMAEGRAKGLAEGRAKGLAEGRAEGRAEGELTKSLSIASNLLSMGMSTEYIMQATGLTQEQINGLKK